MFIIFLAEIAGGILAYVYRAQARELVVGGLTTAIEQHYGRNTTTTASAVTRAVDEIQQQVGTVRSGRALRGRVTGPPPLCAVRVLWRGQQQLRH